MPEAQSGQLAGQLGFNTQETGRHSTMTYSRRVIIDLGLQAGVCSETWGRERLSPGGPILHGSLLYAWSVL